MIAIITSTSEARAENAQLHDIVIMQHMEETRGEPLV